VQIKFQVITKGLRFVKERDIATSSYRIGDETLPGELQQQLQHRVCLTAAAKEAINSVMADKSIRRSLPLSGQDIE